MAFCLVYPEGMRQPTAVGERVACVCVDWRAGCSGVLLLLPLALPRCCQGGVIQSRWKEFPAGHLLPWVSQPPPPIILVKLDD